MKVCFLGTGSTVFAKNILGDCILTNELGKLEISLHDIDEVTEFIFKVYAAGMNKIFMLCCIKG